MLPVSLCLLGDAAHTSTHPRQGSHNRPKYRYCQSPMTFTGVTYRSMGERFYGWRNDSKAAASPRPSPAWVTAHMSWDLEHTAQPASSSASFPGAAVGLNLLPAAADCCCFQAGGLDWVFAACLPQGSSLQLSSSERNSQLSFLPLAERGLENLVSFRGFLLRELPCRMEYFYRVDTSLLWIFL